MDRDISLDAIKLVACIFVCTLHTIGMFMSESSDFHLSYLLFYMSGIAVPLFFMVNGFLLAPKDGGMKYYYRKIFNIVKIVCVFTFIFDIPKLVRGDISIGEFYQFNLSSCIRQQNSLTAQFVSFSLANLANIFYPPPDFYNN